MRREDLDIISKHNLTVTEALLGTNIKVKTVYGEETVKVNQDDVMERQITLEGKVS